MIRTLFFTLIETLWTIAAILTVLLLIVVSVVGEISLICEWLEGGPLWGPVVFGGLCVAAGCSLLGSLLGSLLKAAGAHRVFSQWNHWKLNDRHYAGFYTGRGNYWFGGRYEVSSAFCGRVTHYRLWRLWLEVWQDKAGGRGADGGT